MALKAHHQSERNQALALAQQHIATYAGYVCPQHLQGLEEQQEVQKELFIKEGFPMPYQEAWRFTNIRPLAQQHFDVQQAATCSKKDIQKAQLLENAAILVFLNGVLQEEFSTKSLPEGVTFRQLTPADVVPSSAAHTSPLSALNVAFLTGGYVLEVAEGIDVQTPIEIIHLNTGNVVTHSHNRVVLHPKSSLTLYENYASLNKGGAHWHNVVTHTTLEEEAKLHVFSRQKYPKESFFTQNIEVTAAQNAIFTLGNVHEGARIGRTYVHTALMGEGAAADLYGYNLTQKKQHHSFTTKTVHKVANTTANQCVRNVVAAGGHSAFMGNYTVEQAAQNTVAKMLNQNLLLGPRAKADYKPELEIFAEDVQCSHGATTGSLDQEALFYLQARGVDKATATALLTQAFITEIIENVPSKHVQERLLTAVKAWFTQTEEAA